MTAPELSLSQETPLQTELFKCVGNMALLDKCTKVGLAFAANTTEIKALAN